MCSTFFNFMINLLLTHSVLGAGRPKISPGRVISSTNVQEMDISYSEMIMVEEKVSLGV